MQAADAATTPKPAGQGTQAARPVRPMVEVAARNVVQAQRGSKDLKRSVMGPVKKFSSVILLQVSGTFFAMFALFMGEGLWKARDQLRAAGSVPVPGKLYLHAVVFVAFAYFALSSFVRASKRDRE